ncbi:ABC transporter permease [Sphingomonas sp. URHD0057]|uniref:ABC transporter permease n=1 Tax=Sphingomonas sp. URHD0057 TaxID=1380389 RepID=UPI00048E5EB9|nr:ABC transporter permease [Sphingomonas sp. URHD0057]
MNDQTQSSNAASPAVDRPVTLIRASSGWGFPDARELIDHRELLLFLVKRNIKVRYRQTLLGWGWAVLQPVATMAILTFVFGRLIGLQSDGVPYWIFALTGLVLWTFISQSVSAAAASLVGNSQLVDKVYLPRLAIPLAAILSGLFDLLITFVMLVAVLTIAGYPPRPVALVALAAIPLALLLSVGVGTALAALGVRYRDTAYVLPFALQLWLFATPIAYPLSLVPHKWQPLMALNPAACIVGLFRWAMLGTDADAWAYLPLSLTSLLILLVGGLMIFRRMERSFADVI